MSQRSIYDSVKYPDEYWDQYKDEDGSLAAWNVPHEELEYVLGYMYHKCFTTGGSISLDIGLAIETPEGFIVGDFNEGS